MTDFPGVGARGTMTTPPIARWVLGYTAADIGRVFWWMAVLPRWLPICQDPRAR